MVFTFDVLWVGFVTVVERRVPVQNLFLPLVGQLLKMTDSTSIKFVSGYSFDTIKNSLLLLPSISVANVPQLTADLLLHTLSFFKVGTLNDEFLYSFVSPVDYLATVERPQGVSFGLELYYCEDKNLTLVQQRTPVIAGFHEEHLEKVIWPVIEQAQFQNVVLFHLLDAGLVENILPGTLQVYTNTSLLLQSLKLLQISDSCYRSLSSCPEIETPNMKCLLKRLGESIDYTIVVAYSYEGDNFDDSINMATTVASLLELDVSQWQTPVSWFGVYGDKPVSNAMEDGLYG